MVFEAAELYLNGRGPLREHGVMKGRWGIRIDTEPQLREALSTFFEGRTEMTPDSVTECMGIITSYLDKEVRKAKRQEISLKECSLQEQLVCLNSATRVTAGLMTGWGISPSILQKAVSRGVLREENGVYRGSRNIRTQKLLEDELKPGQSVYRVKDGKVQQMQVVGVDGSRVSVANGEVGSEVEEEDPTKLSAENPEDLDLNEEWDGRVKDIDLGEGYTASIGESNGHFITVVDDGKRVHHLADTQSFTEAKKKASAWLERAKRDKSLEGHSKTGGGRGKKKLSESVVSADPTREEMLEYLQSQGVESSDAEAAMYWFASDYHGGQGTDLYSVVSTSPYTPGPATTLASESEDVREIYDWLIMEYCPEDADDWASDAHGDGPAEELTESSDQPTAESVRQKVQEWLDIDDPSDYQTWEDAEEGILDELTLEEGDIYHSEVSGLVEEWWTNGRD